ncbi:MAG: hypothetical protein EBU01_09980, partial [Crocinitomicaceae bacterium]|nr:hypothetical protein [Crocinitomicaceae bacterium]
VKLVFIWSTWGKIETVDAKRGLKYVQEFENNLDIVHKPKITDCKKKPYTTIEFLPDYKRLGLAGLTEQMVQLFQRRVYDISGITSKDVKVNFPSMSVKTGLSFSGMIFANEMGSFEIASITW